MVQTVFSRYEEKHLMPEHIYRALRERLARSMREDACGSHTVGSIY